jgi:hypothetical protein
VQKSTGKVLLECIGSGAALSTRQFRVPDKGSVKVQRECKIPTDKVHRSRILSSRGRYSNPVCYQQVALLRSVQMEYETSPRDKLDVPPFIV